MLKYEGRTSRFCGGIEHNIECEGTPLTGDCASLGWMAGSVTMKRA